MATKKKVSKQQIQIFVEYFEKYEILRTGKLTPNLAPNTLNMLWQEITETLNNCGTGAVREADKWKTTFIEWKSQVKKRARDGKDMTDIEKRYLKALGVVVIDGIQNVPEIGLTPVVSLPTEIEEHVEEGNIEKIPVILDLDSATTSGDNELNEEAGAVAVEAPTATTSTSAKVAARKPKKKQKNILLEQYVKGQDVQKEGLKAIAAGLSEIALSINHLADVIKNKTN